MSRLAKAVREGSKQEARSRSISQYPTERVARACKAGKFRRWQRWLAAAGSTPCKGPAGLASA